MSPSVKEWLVPILRKAVAAGVALLAAWLLDRLGLAITPQQQIAITDTFTVLGLGVLTFVFEAVSRWLKPRFLRGWHPGVES